jgi:hypothetical protein
VQITLFTIEEANRRAEKIRPELEDLVRTKAEFDRLETRLAVSTMAASGAADSNPDARELRQLRDARRATGQEIATRLQALHEQGALVKDLDRGLVDFYAVSGDRLVFLCWQLGESEVSHWHSLEGGFSARQPLDGAGLE